MQDSVKLKCPFSNGILNKLFSKDSQTDLARFKIFRNYKIKIPAKIDQNAIDSNFLQFCFWQKEEKRNVVLSFYRLQRMPEKPILTANQIFIATLLIHRKKIPKMFA